MAFDSHLSLSGYLFCRVFLGFGPAFRILCRILVIFDPTVHRGNLILLQTRLGRYPFWILAKGILYDHKLSQNPEVPTVWVEPRNGSN